MKPKKPGGLIYVGVGLLVMSVLAAPGVWMHPSRAVGAACGVLVVLGIYLAALFLKEV